MRLWPLAEMGLSQETPSSRYRGNESWPVLPTLSVQSSASVHNGHLLWYTETGHQMPRLLFYPGAS